MGKFIEPEVTFFESGRKWNNTLEELEFEDGHIVISMTSPRYESSIKGLDFVAYFDETHFNAYIAGFNICAECREDVNSDIFDAPKICWIEDPKENALEGARLLDLTNLVWDELAFKYFARAKEFYSPTAIMKLKKPDIAHGVKEVIEASLKQVAVASDDEE